MAKILKDNELTVDIKLNLNIPKETLTLACNILGLYLSQNENTNLLVDRRNGTVTVSLIKENNLEY